jgi:eukaryotic-like serine/threonine-protein kinase
LPESAVSNRDLAKAHRYQRLEALASGGMGTVYLGRMLAGGSARTVAMKVLHPHLANDADMVAMFLDEARVATRLRHPNLVGVLDMDLVGDELVIVMEYVEGSTLGTMQSALRQRGQKLPLEISVRILCDALLGLHEVHELVDETGAPLGLVHRDVSPHNLLVGSDGVTRVTDFGIALAAGRLASTRPDGTVKGKLQYLAPEQVGRKPLDRRVDVFAAGIVLWECLTGERLFDAPTEAESITRVLRDPIAPPSLSRPEVSLELDEVCLRALERDPERRFETAGEFADALRRAHAAMAEAAPVGSLVCDLASDTIRKQRESLDRASAPAPLPPRTRRRLTFAILVMIAVGAATVPFALASRRWATAPRRPALLAAPVAAPLAVPVAAPIEVSPDVPAATPSLASATSSRELGMSEHSTPAKERMTAPRAAPPRAVAPKRAAKPTRSFMPDDL